MQSDGKLLSLLLKPQTIPNAYFIGIPYVGLWAGSTKNTRQGNVGYLRLGYDESYSRFGSVVGAKLSQEEGQKQEVKGSDNGTCWERSQAQPISC